jgi:hypothetical protein
MTLFKHPLSLALIACWGRDAYAAVGNLLTSTIAWGMILAAAANFPSARLLHQEAARIGTKPRRRIASRLKLSQECHSQT